MKFEKEPKTPTQLVHLWKERGLAIPDEGEAIHYLTFIDHYLHKYSEPKLPPTWMIAESLSITAWSKLFEWLGKQDDRKEIARKFGAVPELMQSWMHAICYVRNLCAHHQRLWNREFTIKPRIANRYRTEMESNGRFYASAFVIKLLLLKACPDSGWWPRLMRFVDDHPFVNKRAMGFPAVDES